MLFAAKSKEPVLCYRHLPNSTLALLFSILVNEIAPILLTAGTGFVLGKAFKIDLRSVSRIAFYILSPCLVFISLYQTQLTGEEFGRLTIFTVATMALLGLAAFLFGKALRLNRQMVTALIIINMFGNGGNYGLPLNLLAFGQQALDRAVIYYVTSTVLVYSVGVVVASSGRDGIKQALLGIFKVPVVYGVILAIVLRLANIQLPDLFFQAIKLLSGAALPVMLIVLGLQLAEVKRPDNLKVVTAASVFQLLSGPAIGLLIAFLVGLSGPARQAAVLEASMPTAVITTILAVEYDIDPVFVTGIVLVTTLLSPLTLTPLIAFLR
jgi:predicted permease